MAGMNADFINPFLMSATKIMQEICQTEMKIGKLDATDEEVREAAVIANADSFIRRLPDGYDTMLYSDGSNLSQGQRQLLAIARAAVAKPPVLILDEATSSIDTRTEIKIQNAFNKHRWMTKHNSCYTQKLFLSL